MAKRLLLPSISSSSLTSSQGKNFIVNEDPAGSPQVSNAAAEVWRHLLSDRSAVELVSPKTVGLNLPPSYADSPTEIPSDPLLGTTVHGYQFLRLIQSGGTADVYKVRGQGRIFAAKVSHADPEMLEANRILFRKEFNIISKINHKNIIKVYDLFEHAERQMMILEYFEGTDLARCINWKIHQLAKVMKQLFKALKYIHKKNIIHRDIKPENILVDDHLTVKLIDFGAAMKMKLRDTLLQRKLYFFTPAFAPPEVHADDVRVTRKSWMKAYDIWSLGVTAFLLTSDDFPYQTKIPNCYYIPKTIFNQKLDFSRLQHVDPAAVSLVQQCLQLNVKNRLTANKALKQDYFKQYTFC